MKSFIEYNVSLIQEERDYYEALSLLESARIDENVLSNLTSSVRSKLDFIQSLASFANIKVQDAIALFKDSRVFKFFNAIKFNLNSLWKTVKLGYATYGQVQHAVAEYLSKTKVGKWTEEALADLDNWLKNHPKLKRLGGLAVAGMLIYIWMNMSFTGNFNYDFDFSSILAAVSGSYSLSTLFAGPDGTRMLMLFVTGIIGLSFPWPGPTSAKFVVALLNGLRKLIHSR
jgi:hypothetical protein